MFSKAFTAVLALAASQLVSTQTSTDCDPRLKNDCPTKINPALGKTETIDFTKGANSDFFEIAAGTTIKNYDNQLGAEFQINKETDAPTFTSKKWIFFGKVSVTCRASLGTGIVTSVVLQSADLDEIDWEWLGGDKAQVQTNYFGKGDTTTYDRGAYHAVANPQEQFYTYTIDWTPEYVKWSINDQVVRTLLYADAKGGSTFPQTPAQLKIGTWVAGGKNSPKGTVEWAGGYTDFSQAPFNGYYKSITVEDFHKGASSYEWPEAPNDGSYKIIKVNTGGDSGNATSSSTVTKTTSGATATATPTDGTKTNSTMMTTTTTGRGLTQATDGSDIISSSANSTIMATRTPSATSAQPAATTSAPARNAAGKQTMEWTNAVFVGAGLLAYLAL